MKRFNQIFTKEVRGVLTFMRYYIPLCMMSTFTLHYFYMLLIILIKLKLLNFFFNSVLNVGLFFVMDCIIMVNYHLDKRSECFSHPCQDQGSCSECVQVQF